LPPHDSLFKQRRRKATEVEHRLSVEIGMRLPPASERRDIVHELIHAILSQNTSRKNYDLAYQRLMDVFPDINALGEAPVAAIELAIRSCGLSRQKSSAIKAILAAAFLKRGDYSLEFVRDMKVRQARDYLTSLTGVGPKTASVVLMFADGRGVMPVDTHVLRTSKRLGLIDEKTTAAQAQSQLEALVPPAKRPGMHLNLVRLGREICHVRAPRHDICPVNMLCEKA